jgi:NAD(P)-dependent dehydrogenase (short-subunit alcohol dehydrogenase family)
MRVERPECTMMGDTTTLAGRRALVTGAGSGIGRAIARVLATEGMHLVLVGRDEGRLRAAAGEIGSRAAILRADLVAPDGIRAVADGAGDTLDVLVHSAGAYVHGRLIDISAAEWDALDAVNLRAPVHLTVACLPALRAASGQVVFVNSTAALRPGAGGAYALGKAALRAATDTLRQEVNADGIRVLTVFPGRTDTPMQEQVLAAEKREAPPGTLIRPEDVANMVLAALKLPRSAEVTDIMMRPMRPL